MYPIRAWFSHFARLTMRPSSPKEILTIAQLVFLSVTTIQIAERDKY